MSENINENRLDLMKEKILKEINRLGNGTPVLWKVFILCMTPGILNGLHISSYVYLGHVSENITCVVPALMNNGVWNLDSIKSITSRGINNKCKILNWNYTQLSEMDANDALSYVQTNKLPADIACKDLADNYFFHENKGDSIVAEWDLICDRDILRTTVQVALALGKFIGAFLFGIVADKFGRKSSITVASILYVVCGPISALSNNYWLFLLFRLGLGIAGSGVYHSAYTILTEFTAPNYRATLSILFSISYPIGMMILSLAAFLVHPWRLLQLTISLPAVLLIIQYIFLDESPMWLLSKGKINQAHKIVFGKSLDDEKEFLQFENKMSSDADNENVVDVEKNSNKTFFDNFMERAKHASEELVSLYGNSVLRRRLLICHLTFFVASFTYYVIALNGDNFSANQYVYVAVTGLTEVPSYIIPCLMLQYMGRKKVSLLLYFMAGISLLLILAIPQDESNFVITVALFGRTCVSAVFAVVILHTAELFPTTLRNSAIGTSSTMAHVGSILAPYIADGLGVVAWFIPTTICGIIAIMAGLFVLYLPETENTNLKNTVEETTARSSNLLEYS